MIKHIKTIQEFHEEIASGKTLVDFFATWCGPCRMLSPLVERLAEEHPEIKVLKVDTDQVPQAASEYQVYSIPTLVLIEDGKTIEQAAGYRPYDSLVRFCRL